MDSADDSEEETAEEQEEFLTLQARWLKLVRAKEQEPLAKERSEQGRNPQYLCCFEGKRKGQYA
ncbi:hypothetical protein AAVH_18429, partial [Aphelenchoides avenae]